jgi:hypothetical protein
LARDRSELDANILEPTERAGGLRQLAVPVAGGHGRGGIDGVNGGTGIGE